MNLRVASFAIHMFIFTSFDRNRFTYKASAIIHDYRCHYKYNKNVIFFRSGSVFLAAETHVRPLSRSIISEILRFERGIKRCYPDIICTSGHDHGRSPTVRSSFLHCTRARRAPISRAANTTIDASQKRC